MVARNTGGIVRRDRRRGHAQRPDSGCRHHFLPAPAARQPVGRRHTHGTLGVIIGVGGGVGRTVPGPVSRGIGNGGVGQIAWIRAVSLSCGRGGADRRRETRLAIIRLGCCIRGWRHRRRVPWAATQAVVGLQLLVLQGRRGAVQSRCACATPLPAAAAKKRMAAKRRLMGRFLSRSYADPCSPYFGSTPQPLGISRNACGRGGSAVGPARQSFPSA